jgi:hypothetical protein
VDGCVAILTHMEQVLSPAWRRIATVSAAACLAACSGVAPTPEGPASPGGLPSGIRHRADALVGFSFKISRHRRTRRAHYLSPSTASLVLAAYDSSHVKKFASLTLDAIPGSGGCTPIVSGTFTCTAALAAPAGKDTFDVTAFDKAGGTGTALSSLDDFAFTVIGGKANAIAMTLDGIPAKVAVALHGSSILATGSQSTGFQFAGIGKAAAQELQVTALDADGNTIVGPGAPEMGLSSNDARVSISPVTGSGTLFLVTPLAQTNAVPNPSAGIALTATATPQDGSPASASANVQFEPLVYVLNDDAPLTAYVPWSTTPVVSIAQSGLKSGLMVLDSQGNVYVSNSNAGSVTEYAPASTTVLRSITGLNTPEGGLAVDAAGDIFVEENEVDVKEFTPTGGNAASRTLSGTGIAKPYGLAVDGAGNLYVSNFQGSSGVSIFGSNPTSTALSAEFDAGMSGPIDIKFDASGSMYVCNYSGANVTEYAAPFSNSSAVGKTFGSSPTLNIPGFIAVDASKNVYVQDQSAVTEFASGAPSVVVRTLSGSMAPENPIVDALGNVWVVYRGNVLNAYAPGTGTTPLESFTTGLADPQYLAVWP